MSGSKYLPLPIPPKIAILELNNTELCAHLGTLFPSIITYCHILIFG